MVETGSATPPGGWQVIEMIEFDSWYGVCLLGPAMSQPREIVPGATYLITRRTLRRHLLFRPDAVITQLLVYALAVSTSRFGVQMHALCAMSTHLHLVVTDVQGVLPRFLQYFHRLVALGTKVLRKWEGPVWDHEATSVVRLLTRGAVVEKIAYVLANPVAAGLVRHASEWPGGEGERRRDWPRRAAGESSLGVSRPVEPPVAQGSIAPDCAAADRRAGHRSAVSRRGRRRAQETGGPGARGDAPA
jgi:putative transposase